MNVDYCPSCGELLEQCNVTPSAYECPDHGRVLISLTDMND